MKLLYLGKALQQRGRGGSLDSGAGAVGKLSAAAAAAAPAVRPLADFAFIRSAPKRRVSAGRTGMLVNTPSAPTGPMGSCCVEELRRLNWKTNVVEAQAPPGHTSRIDGGDADGSREGIEPSDGDSDDGSDENFCIQTYHAQKKDEKGDILAQTTTFVANGRTSSKQENKGVQRYGGSGREIWLSWWKLSVGDMFGWKRGRPYFYNARLRWVDGWVGDVGVGVVRLGHQPVRPSGTERALLMMGPAEVGALLGAIPPHPAAPSRAPPLLASWLAAAAAAAAAAYSRNYQLL
ncbi:hypothetical protein VOLCADRAFT_100931 [Volvox carteri f. nagariensis]|uniref:Uncharacterized protein n=1 Tax=Volvox carteri f. nagariensis TaxID=3068 RepID=D8ULC9_VOLCA|nr:uncharacterized protein VOLCADRAFT_100931 [Volvox carteri f. nagariensis]EFJ39472.1 hypothetical protein VOLCADRAFT_100931 [Volvox carteri f. nagariensis]|eukprot:XP_002959465.1 hypothetical protein VOLCADRAFT_100931 [Volvox carteri f. nagariensis]